MRLAAVVARAGYCGDTLCWRQHVIECQFFSLSIHANQQTLSLSSAPVTGDTKGIVGPETMWRDVQFKKVQLLSQLYGLRPWYCTAAPDACACGGAGCGGASDSHMRTPYAGAAAQQIMTADVKQLMALAGRRLRALAV